VIATSVPSVAELVTRLIGPFQHMATPASLLRASSRANSGTSRPNTESVNLSSY
jgi:hypothetical protein